jgi:hypothetical protein
MKRVAFDPDQLSVDKRIWWDKWIKRADAATQILVNKWEAQGKLEAKDFQSAVWGDLKVWLLEHAFAGNCAYCETKLDQARQPGHAEHFRPKAAVRNKVTAADGTVHFQDAETLDPMGNKLVHPGYFWLAYCWENLLPSCNNCNTGQGKNNQFPVLKAHVLLRAAQAADLPVFKSRYVASVKWPGYYYVGPRELEADEDRLLLHPYFDDPREHITFGIRGIEAARIHNGEKSPRGVSSIEVYELDAKGLRRARQDQQLIAYSQYSTAYDSAVKVGFKTPQEAHDAGLEAIRNYFNNAPPYSAAIDDYIKLYARR